MPQPTYARTSRPTRRSGGDTKLTRTSLTPRTSNFKSAPFSPHCGSFSLSMKPRDSSVERSPAPRSIETQTGAETRGPRYMLHNSRLSRHTSHRAARETRATAADVELGTDVGWTGAPATARHAARRATRNRRVGRAGARRASSAYGAKWDFERQRAARGGATRTSRAERSRAAAGTRQPQRQRPASQNAKAQPSRERREHGVDRTARGKARGAGEGARRVLASPSTRNAWHTGRTVGIGASVCERYRCET